MTYIEIALSIAVAIVAFLAGREHGFELGLIEGMRRASELDMKFPPKYLKNSNEGIKTNANHH